MVRARRSFPVSGTSCGTSAAHRASACGQRGWNAHPGGIARRSGGEPGMPVIAIRGPCIGGNEFSSP